MKRKSFINSEKGLTLVELLASIVILSIILISVLLIFNQTMRANNNSESIIDATYLAQKEMEKIYNISRGPTPQLLSSDGYIYQTNVDSWRIYYKEIEDSNFSYEIKTAKAEDDLMRVVVKVYDDPDKTNLKAQMENLYKWGASE